MSENRGIMLAKSVQKHAGRAKEKILQNLGKVDCTSDEIFDDHLNNFNRQQASANRLQKEFNNYIRCVRAAQTASKSLMDAVCEIYEPQWTGHEALQAQTGASESLWADFAHKLGDQVLIPLNTYTGQFPEMKKKVEKRNRKLIDYDGQRHSFQNLQANANKRKDDVKLTKGREQLEEARRTYEILNTELHDELPALYDSRILFLVTNLQTLFATENVFHNETAKIYSELEAIVDKLATESQRGSNTLRKQTSNPIKTSSPVQPPVNKLNNANINSNYQNQITTNGGSSLANSPTSTSSSLQEPRFDSVSSTPEPPPESPAAAVAAATPSSPTENGVTTKSVERPELSALNASAKATTTTQTSPTEEKVVVSEVKPSQTEGATAAAVVTTATPAPPATPAQVNGNNNEPSIPKEGGKHPKELPSTTSNAEAAAEAAANNGNSIEEHKQKKLDTDKVVTKSDTDTDTKSSTGTSQKGRPVPVVNRHSVNNLNKNPFEDDDDRIYEVPADANTADLPPGVLYRVKATYGYVKEDVDELSFEIGDLIRVIEYDDPEDQEEGWLMGQKEGTTEKGLFPANFTRPI
ncbi:myc box-dependent-interacting protein 1 isoform X2 [Drosophila subpulchrella]|uniref:myc box-dependent-interacting protein 1 isoform X2 n=1 Tax=Drosophila subpulchrella TaxID=1486046 RepID=UPI0018A15BF9|nr:myc box-dependent-interacting protein 1 isoform X2 [Drosophila subpulchrella]